MYIRTGIFSILKSMKKLNFLCFFFILFCFSFSQEFNEKLKNARMGLYVSPTINFIQTESDQTESNSNPAGVIYGYAIEVALNDNHRLESGFSISYKGGGLLDITSDATGTSTNYEIQYVTLPFFMKMRSREIGYFNYFARIGPSINFKIKETIDPNDSDAESVIVDISIFLGAEYSLGGETSIEGSLFFNNNITNALKENNSYLFHQLGLRLGFLF